MHSSKIELRKWTIPFCLISTDRKGISSHRLARELGITHKSAWHVLHRIRETWNAEFNRFARPVDADETYIGGKVADMGVKGTATNLVWVQPVERTDGATMSGLVSERTMPDAKVYTDEAVWFNRIPRDRESVNHRIKEFVRGKAHTNGIEAFWAMLKRGHYGVFHHFSAKHTHRYVNEFVGRHNTRALDTIEQMAVAVLTGIGKRLRYVDLIGPKHTRQPRLLAPAV